MNSLNFILKTYLKCLYDRHLRYLEEVLGHIYVCFEYLRELHISSQILEIHKF